LNGGQLQLFVQHKPRALEQPVLHVVAEFGLIRQNFEAGAVVNRDGSGYGQDAGFAVVYYFLGPHTGFALKRFDVAASDQNAVAGNLDIVSDQDGRSGWIGICRLCVCQACPDHQTDRCQNGKPHQA
jgi:hypothetical protein